MPKISAVIPVYNVEKYLPRCIESALGQTLEDIEIICVDDGSTDGCPAMLDEYARRDSRVKVIHQPNGGYGKAMNAGLRAARGEYFAVLESDDFILPDAYEVLYANARKFDADVVRADFFFFRTLPDGRIHLVPKQIAREFDWYYRLICPNEEPEVYKYVMHNWTGIHRLSFLREKEIRYNETPGASYQDNGFWFQVYAQTDRLVFIPQSCYCYRVDNPGSSIHDPNKVYTMAEEYAYIRRFLDGHPEFSEKVESAYYARLFRAYDQTYERIDRKFRPEFLRFFRDSFRELDRTGAIPWEQMTDGEQIRLRALLLSPKAYEGEKREKIFGFGMLIKLGHFLRREGLDGLLRRIRRKLGGPADEE